MLGLLWTMAFASVEEDLQLAADGDLDESARMVAFNRLVTDHDVGWDTLVKAAGDDDWAARERWIAVRVIGSTDDERAEAALVELTSDPMPAIRVAAATALADVGATGAGDTLIDLLDDKAIIVRAAAADSLGALKERKAIDPLAEAIADSSNYHRGSSLWVRGHYVDALGDIGSRDAIPALITCFDDTDPTVGDAALESLYAIVGYDFAEGRSRDEHMEAWRRWWKNGGRI